MAFPTFSDLIQRVLVELRQEPGISVQQYSEDIVAAILQRQFNTFFDHYWWPTYLRGQAFTLNGVTGRVIEDLTDTIKRVEDIRYIWHENNTVPIPMLPPMTNPFANSYRMHWYPDSTGKIFWITPISTTGQVVIEFRTKPEPFLPNDEVKLDDDLLVLATCYSYLADDEDSPSAVKKFAEAAGKREAQLREALNKGPIPIGGAAYSPFNDWMTSP